MAMAAEPRTEAGITTDMARVHDYLLGGADSYDADRQLAARLAAAWPDPRPGRPPGAVDLLLRSLLYMERAVREVRAAGIRQFVDVGVTLPVPYTAPSGAVLSPPHEVAADARVAYVIPDPLSASSARQRLRAAGHVSVVCEDPAVPEDVLGSPDLTGIIDKARPAGLLCGLRCSGWPSWYAKSVVDEYVRCLAPGSWVAITVAIPGGELREKLGEAVPDRGAHVYSRADVEALFQPHQMLGGGVDIARGFCPEVVEPESAAVVLAGLAKKIRHPKA